MTPVEFCFVLPTGEAMANAEVEIQLGRASHTGQLTGITLPRPITVNTDAEGKVVLSLWPSTTAYYVQVLDTESEAGIFYKFLVPEVPTGSVVRLQDLVIDAPMSGVSYDDAALLAIHDAKASARTSELAAAASAAEAAASVVDMSNTIASALASAEAAAGSATQASDSAAAAALSEFNARVHAENAAASAQSAAETITTVAENLGRRVDICNYGALPDNATDTQLALTKIKAELGGGGVIKFPYVRGTANIYSFTTTDFTKFSGMTLDVDEGVTLSFPDDGFVYTTQTYKVERPFKVHIRSPLYDLWETGNRNRPLADKKVFLDASDIERDTLKPVLCNTSDLLHKQVPWPASDTFAAAVPAATSVSSITWTNPTVNAFSVSLARVQPGDEISAYFDGFTGSPALVALARGAGGFAGMYASIADDGGGTQTFRKDAGVAAVVTDIGYDGKGTHASYAGARSVWTLRMVSWTNFVVLFNGMQVAALQVNGPIEEAGFGVFAGAAASAAVRDLVIRRNCSTRGVSLATRLAVFGDSLSAPRYEAWPNYMRESLEGTLGIRVVSMVNRAVSGDNSSGQWSIMNAQGIGGANVVLVLVGTNDIQGQVSKAAFVSNLQSMLAYCQANGATLMLAVQPQFYSRNQVPASFGQPTQNYEKGNYIRAATLRFAADNALRCVDLNQVLGPILGNYVNPALSPYWGGDLMNDPMVMDNIHPSPVMERLIGVAMAKMVAGGIASQGANIVPGSLAQAPTALSASTLLNGWLFTTETPRWTTDANGNVNFSGIVNKGPSIGDGTDILQLPRHLWPPATRRVQCSTDQFQKPCMLQITTTGLVTLYGAQAGVNYVYVDGMAWNIRQA